MLCGVMHSANICKWLQEDSTEREGLIGSHHLLQLIENNLPWTQSVGWGKGQRRIKGITDITDYGQGKEGNISQTFQYPRLDPCPQIIIIRDRPIYRFTDIFPDI